MIPADRLVEEAIALHRQGRIDEAATRYEAALAEKPDRFEALHMLGVVRLQQQRVGEAIALMERALALRPESFDALCDIAFAFVLARRLEEAIARYDRALALRQDDPNVLFDRARALASEGRYGDSIVDLDKVIAAKPGFIDARMLHGAAALALGRGQDAALDFEQVLVHEPGSQEALFRLGQALTKQGRLDEAIGCFDSLLSIAPDHASALNERGVALWSMNRHEAAIASYDRAIATGATIPALFYNRGNAWFALNRYQQAIDDYDKALAFAPSYAEACRNRGHALTNLKRLDEAAASYTRALSLNPALPYAVGYAVQARAQICDWSDYEASIEHMVEEMRQGRRACDPFTLLCLTDDPADQLACAKAFVDDNFGTIDARFAGVRSPRRRERIHVAYLSADFHEHATSYLIAELFELHDRSRFDISAFSFGPETGGPMRARIRAATDRFFDVRAASDDDIANRVRGLDVDIAVDLKGHTLGSRPGIFARRPAPVQVGFLGYPGTAGAPFIDYIIGDAVVIPDGDERYYSEAVVRLPGSYQVNDSKRRIADDTPTRSELGLPDAGVVFCCFNATFKITPSMFDSWTRLLKRVDDSVLWLLRGNPTAAENLRREAAKRGIDPRRLIFAPWAPLNEHLARQRRADLFLDTVPCNAHTTASDALWAGLPVLTCCGRSFASRVAASLLSALDLPELIARSLPEYEERAVQLATDETLLRAITDKLQESRDAASLFDANAFRRHLEAAYATIWERHAAGQRPHSFRIRPPDAGVMSTIESANEM